MSITSGHAFLVYPGKGSVNPKPVEGQSLALSGKLFDMLQKLFVAQPADKDFEVVFSHDEDGNQFNECRELLVGYQQAPTKESGLAIANRLQSVTDGRSGPGLLFLMLGQYGTQQRMVLSRFPADEAILAETGRNGLSVELLDQVFIRRMAAYKALLLESPSPPDEFWTGTATDRQAGGDAENISAYWIRDFLRAEFAESPKAATRRLADALRHAIQAHPNVEIKSRIASAVSLAPQMFDGKLISIRSFCEQVGFDKDTVDTVVGSLSKPHLAEKQFQFSAREFKKKLPTRVVHLENGAVISAPSQKFEKLVEKVEQEGDIVEYRVRGRVADERVRK